MKIALLNTQTEKPEYFEAVDAREVLAMPDSIYKLFAASQQPVQMVGGKAVSTGGESLAQADAAVLESLKGMTVAALQEWLNQKGIAFPSRANKAELEEIYKRANATVVTAPAPSPSAPAVPLANAQAPVAPAPGQPLVKDGAPIGGWK